MKIIDCFSFYNEIDILTYKLNILNDYIDYFVIVECTHTHIGNEKKLYFNENKHLFEKFNHKIIHIIADEPPIKNPSLINNINRWDNDKYQKNSIARGIKCIKELTDNDLIIITDLDEITNPDILNKIKNGEIEININILEMDLYFYNLNTKFKDKWIHPKILTFKIFNQLNMTCNDIRYISDYYTIPKILNAGWHLTYFADKYNIRNKLQNSGHTEYNTSKFTNLDYIQEKINTSSSLFEDDRIAEFIKLEDNNNLPTEYEKYLSKYIIK